MNCNKGCSKVFYPTIGQIPTSYLMSLTYEEQLLWYSKKLCEMIEIVNKNTEDIAKLDGLRQEIEEELEKVQKAIEELDDFKAEVEEEVREEMQVQYNRVLQLMRDYQIIFSNDLDNAVNTLNDRIDSIELGDVMAYDPTTGQYENVSTAIQNVYDALRSGGITASVFDSLELTCTAFQNYDMTAQDFDIRANEILL